MKINKEYKDGSLSLIPWSQTKDGTYKLQCQETKLLKIILFLH